MHRSGVIAVADLRSSCHDVALVDTMLAGGAVVPAVVPDVEVSAKPDVVFGLGALNSLVVQRALLLPLNIIVKNGTEPRHDLGLSKSHFHHLEKSIAKSLVVPLDQTIECETAYGIIDQRGETPSKPSLKLDVIWLLG